MDTKLDGLGLNGELDEACSIEVYVGGGGSCHEAQYYEREQSPKLFFLRVIAPVPPFSLPWLRLAYR